MADENMQMGAIDETKLVRRTGGKNVKTQLSKGDPDIIPDLKYVKSKRPVDHFVDMQMRGAFYQALLEVLKAEKGAKPDVKIEVLNDTAKLFADAQYKPQLLRAEQSKMHDKRMAEMVNVQAYRAKLEQLRFGYAKAGKVREQEACTTLITALNKKTLLRPDQLTTVFDTLGADVKMTQKQAEPVMNNLQDQGLLAEEDVIEYLTKVKPKGSTKKDKDTEKDTTRDTTRDTKKDTKRDTTKGKGKDADDIKADNVTKFMTTRVSMRPDYKIASKYLPEDATGFETFRPSLMDKTRLQSGISPQTTKRTSRPTISRMDQTVKVNLDDRTDRTATMVDFKHVGTKIAGLKTTAQFQ